MSKHTPGPWKVVYSGMHERDDCDWSEKAEPTVIVPGGLEPLSQRVGHCGEADPEREANARLIAAAPELLAVLREFATDIDAVDWFELEDNWPDLAITFNKAKAAIAKATTD